MPSPQGPRNALDTTTSGTAPAIDWAVPYIFPRPGGATCVLTANAKSYQLVISNFGFSIPTGATLDGIVVTVDRYQSAGSGVVKDFEVTLGAATDNKADPLTAWPGSSTPVYYGTPGDTWGGTLTVGTINSSAWGVVLSVWDTDLMSGATAAVDNVRVTVYYTGGIEPVVSGYEACAPVRSQTRVAMLPY